jgi:CRISPR/Cas system-associated exonuclease Cas4 (RecB family)
MLDPLSVNIPLTERVEKLVLPKRKMLRQVEGTDDYIWEVDYSTISDFMCCPRKGENRVVHGREAQREQVALHFGRLFHTLEEKRMRNGLTDQSVKEQQSMIEDHFVYHPVPPDEYRTANRMHDVIKKYNDIHKTDEWPAKVLIVDGRPFVERPFKIELMTIEVNAKIPYHPGMLVDGKDLSELRTEGFYIANLHVIYVGKIDCGLSDATGLWVVDNKTSSRGGREFEEAFRLSLQTRGYVWAMKKIMDQQVMGLIMNAVIVRPLTKTGTGTTFSRHTYFYSEDSILEWEDNMKAIISDFISHLQRGFFPQHARSFNSPCAHCDYNENCPLPRSQRAADLASNLYRDVTWNPMYE